MINLNPVYKKELKLSARTAKLAAVICIFNFVLASIGLLVFYAVFQNAGYNGRIDYSEMIMLYVLLTTIEFGLILFIVPALTASAISGERERQTLDILLTTKMTPFQIVIGKLESSLSTLLLILLSSFPILSLVFAFGGIRLTDLLKIMLFFLVTAIFIGSFGIYCSTLYKKTTISTVFAYGGLLLILGGTIFILVLIFIIMTLIEQNSGSYQTPKLGVFILILLINPACSFYALITEQIGSVDSLSSVLREISGFEEAGFLLTNWLTVSIIIQLLFAGLFIYLSTKHLNPLRVKKRKRK